LREKVLAATNRFRHQHNARPLAWNESLVKTANDWATRCATENSGSPPIQGENVAARYENVTSAIEDWGNERDNYDFDNPKVDQEGIGHFTQLVWKGTTTVGCAAVDCPASLAGWIIVCQYWPPGNVKDASTEDGSTYYRANVEAKVHDGEPLLAQVDCSNATDASDATETFYSSKDGVERDLLWSDSTSTFSGVMISKIGSGAIGAFRPGLSRWWALAAVVLVTIVQAR
jgi:Cysteine-rich secretory protein family